MYWYNHISGENHDIYPENFEDLNTAKREMIKIAAYDEDMYEYDARIEISKDLMSVTTYGRRDKCEYYIEETRKTKTNKNVSGEITDEELDEIIKAIKEENENAECVFV